MIDITVETFRDINEELNSQMTKKDRGNYIGTKISDISIDKRCKNRESDSKNT